jgi:hypothetical protein
MKNSKNKKRLTALVLVLLLTFVGGAAFAFVNGNLEILGTVNLRQADLYVRWTNVEAPPVPFGFIVGGGATQSYTLAPRGVRTNQIINWEVNFDATGMEAADFPFVASITATATNESSIDAYLEGLILNFVAAGAAGTYTAADFGLTFDVDGYDNLADFNAGSGFLGFLAAGAGRPVEVTITWDGTIPASVASAFVTGYDADDNPIFVPAFNFTLDIEYTEYQD